MSLLEVKNVTQKYNDVTIIDDISFSVEKGEIVCIIGKSGVGKTTLFQVISGIIKPEYGDVILENENITGKTGKVSYMLQKDMLLPFKNIIDNVSLPYRINGEKFKSYKGYTVKEGFNKFFHQKKIARETVKPYFEQFGLSGYEYKYPYELSGGMRQRVAFMRTYFFGKGLMLLDEPFSALDEITKTGMYEWYLKISKELNLTTIFISHSLDEAITISDRILVLSGKPGRIIKEIDINKTSSNFTTSSEFMEYKKQLKNLLNID